MENINKAKDINESMQGIKIQMSALDPFVQSNIPDSTETKKRGSEMIL